MIFIEMLLITQYLLFFLLVLTQINLNVFQLVSTPQIAVHASHMDFPNLVHTLAAFILMLC